MSAIPAPRVCSENPPMDEWIEQFHRDGFLVVHNVLPEDLIDQLKADLDAELGETNDPQAKAEIHLRMFESSRANLSLFDREPIVTFAERLIGDDRPKFGAEAVHVIHNNSF